MKYEIEENAALQAGLSFSLEGRNTLGTFDMENLLKERWNPSAIFECCFSDKLTSNFVRKLFSQTYEKYSTTWLALLLL